MENVTLCRKDLAIEKCSCSVSLSELIVTLAIIIALTVITCKVVSWIGKHAIAKNKHAETIVSVKAAITDNTKDIKELNDILSKVKEEGPKNEIKRIIDRMEYRNELLLNIRKIMDNE